MGVLGMHQSEGYQPPRVPGEHRRRVFQGKWAGGDNDSEEREDDRRKCVLMMRESPENSFRKGLWTR